MKAAPGTIFFILTNTIGIFTGMPMCSHIGKPRQTSAYIPTDQPNSPADCGVSPPALAKYVLSTIDTKFSTYRAINYYEMSARMGGSLTAIYVVLGVINSFYGRNNHRQIFRAATGHYRVYSDFFNGCSSTSGLKLTDYVVAVSISIFEHLVNQIRSRWNYGKTVSPT